MTHPALRELREKLAAQGSRLSFADLGEPLLEDLAVVWHGGRPLAVAAAELLSLADDIPVTRRDRQIAGRAMLTLLARRSAPVTVLIPAEQVFLLGNKAVDDGDAEAEAAWERREQEYASLSAFPQAYDRDEFRKDSWGAFRAARTGALDADALGPDKIALGHRLALMCKNLPPGLRQWFHRRYGVERADVLAWKFILAVRGLRTYRRSAGAEIPLDGSMPAPDALVDATLALPLGDLARTTILDPV